MKKENKQTWSEIEELVVVLSVKFDGIWNCAFPTNWTNLFANDSVDIVCNVINVCELLRVKFWPRFKWIFKVEITKELICWTKLLIWLADCFW